jgi:hypothetical protein
MKIGFKVFDGNQFEILMNVSFKLFEVRREFLAAFHDLQVSRVEVSFWSAISRRFAVMHCVCLRLGLSESLWSPMCSFMGKIELLEISI